MFKSFHSMTIIFSILMMACSTDSNGKNPKTSQKITIHPGEARFIQFDKLSKEGKLTCRDKEYKYFDNGSQYGAFIAESYFSEMNDFDCLFKDGKTSKIVASFNVVKKKFPEEKLKVDPRKITLRKKDQIRVAKEQEVLNKLYASSTSTPYFQTSFMAPLNSHITSIYGIKRTYNKQHKGQHLGTDFRAAIGDKIPAANRGKVVFSGDLFYTGWTVIIDHGLDIFTVYGHLSKTLVESGQIVQKGDLIGLSGNTGRTSGPHLHWGVKIVGQYIDGIDLSEHTKQFYKE
ncbi:MAG: M23 family metallopeptidase [Bacteriovoracaceae bacterium]|jgi:murein DD-endopeptidase MepM/ murein hydrolase activator NlpD